MTKSEIGSPVADGLTARRKWHPAEIVFWLIAFSSYFLLPGKHWNQDIPELADEAAAKHPGVSYLVAAPFGVHPLMADVVSALPPNMPVLSLAQPASSAAIASVTDSMTGRMRREGRVMKTGSGREKSTRTRSLVS